MRCRRACALGLAAVALAWAPAAEARPRWDTRVLAAVPPPGFPAHAYVHPNGRIYEGTYVNLAGDTQPSRIFEYSGDGTLLRSWTMPGQDLAGDTGVQVATSDARGRLVLLDHTPARALLLDRASGEFSPYATFPPDAVPNYAAWAPDGSLYVTDYAVGRVFRVPPGGGAAEIWLADPRLSSVEFGTTGIELAPDGRALLITQQTSPGAGNPVTGGLFRVPIQPDGGPGELVRVWESGPMDLADGFAVARSGRIYIAALGPNQIVVLGPDGREQERFPPVLLSGENGSGRAFASPSSAMFLGTRLIVPSQDAILGNPDNQVIHDVETGEEGVPELIPPNAGLRAGETAGRVTLRVTPRRVRAGSARRFTFRAGRAGVVIRFAGRTATTGADGRALLRVRLRQRRVYRAVATAPYFTSGRAAVRAR